MYGLKIWLISALSFTLLYSNASYGQPDTEAPSVVSTVPEDNTTSGVLVSVRATDKTEIIFNEIIAQPSSGGYGALVSISPDVEDTESVSFDVPQKKLTVPFSTTLSYDTEYTVTITGAEDNAGNEMPQYSYSFKTGLAPSVTVGTASNICIGEQTGTQIGDIVITENLTDNFVNLASPVAALSLRLDAPNGFVFTNKGSASNTSTETTKDLVVIDTRLINSNKSLVIDYKLCDNPPTCTTERTAASDIITLTGVEIAAPDASLVASGTYAITRSADNSGGNNDAIMPGLGQNTTFATLTAVGGPDIVLINENYRHDA